MWGDRCLIDIVGMGDSLTYGYPYGPKASWLNLVAEKLGLIVVNKGVSGETTGEMLTRFDQDVISLRPRIVIIMGGTNDAWASISVSEVKNNVETMADKALQNNITPVIGLPTPLCKKEVHVSIAFLERMADFLENYRQAYLEIAKSRDLQILNFFAPPLLDKDNWGKKEFFNDGGHPNQEGYKVMADMALSSLKNIKIKES
ncbi:MAG: hypothetical protein PWP31_1309 [Clostridia bacterium]|nr:hypothetical protein [Clostridia bacterium]